MNKLHATSSNRLESGYTSASRRGVSPHTGNLGTSPRNTQSQQAQQTFEEVFRSIANPAAEQAGSNEVKRMSVMEKKLEEDRAALTNEFPQYLQAIDEAKKDMVAMLLDRAEMMDFMQQMGGLMKTTNARMFSDEEHMYLKQSSQLAKFYELFAPRVASVLFPDMKIPVKRNILDYVESSQRSKFMRMKTPGRDGRDGEERGEQGEESDKEGQRDGRRGKDRRRPREVSRKGVVEASPSQEEDDEDVEGEEALSGFEEQGEDSEDLEEEDDEEEVHERKRRVIRKPAQPVAASGCGAWDMGGYEEEIVETTTKKKVSKKNHKKQESSSNRAKKKSSKNVDDSENLQKIDLEETDQEGEDDQYQENRDPSSDGNSSDEFFRKKGYSRSYGRDQRYQRRTDLTSSHRRKYENARSALKNSKNSRSRNISREPRIEIEPYKQQQDPAARRTVKDRKINANSKINHPHEPRRHQEQISEQSEEHPDSSPTEPAKTTQNKRSIQTSNPVERGEKELRETRNQEKRPIVMKNTKLERQPQISPKKTAMSDRNHPKETRVSEVRNVENSEDQEQIDMIMKNMARIMSSENPITSPTKEVSKKPTTSSSEYVNYSSNSPIGQHSQAKTGGINLRSKAGPGRATSASSRNDSTKAQKDHHEDIRSKAQATYNPSYSKVNGSPGKIDSELDAPILEYTRGKSPKPRGAPSSQSDLPPIPKSLDSSKYENQIYLGKKRHMYIALKDFRLPDKNFFPLRQGDVVCSVATVQGWYFVYREENPKKFGFVPGNYLNIIR